MRGWSGADKFLYTVLYMLYCKLPCIVLYPVLKKLCTAAESLEKIVTNILSRDSMDAK